MRGYEYKIVVEVLKMKSVFKIYHLSVNKSQNSRIKKSIKVNNIRFTGEILIY